jgi:hypothetical protein
METRIYESDPFTAKPQDLLVTFDSDYRFERKDELYIDRPQGRLKVRVIDVRVHVADGGRLTRDILALKL